MSSRPPTATEPRVLEREITRISDRAEAWARTSTEERRRLLGEVRQGIQRAAEGWANAVALSKGVSPENPLAGEDWLAGPMSVARHVRLLDNALAAGGKPRPPRVRERDERWIADVLPLAVSDRLTLPGWRAEVWGVPGSAPTQGRAYREPASGGLAAVLAAGNVSAIGPCDVLHKLLVENAVTVMKMHPVNAAGGPFIEQAFRPLIEAGFLAVVYGDAAVGRALVEHPQVNSVHLTGAGATFEAIVWGASAEERAERRAANSPRLAKSVTAELGCVTPVIVVPGPWTDADLERQAQNVAGMVTQNASHNCNAAKVVLLARGWPLRDRFLERLESALAAAPPRIAYYPGSAQRYADMLARYPGARVLGRAGESVVPWTLLRDVPARAGEHALEVEAFCGVLAEVSLDTTDPADHLAAAVDFVNDSVWGDLSCVILVADETERLLGARLEHAIAALRYGGVAVNAWPGALFGLMSTTWGAFPKPQGADLQSGVGVVHGTFLFDHPEKSVLRTPFRPPVTPVWFPGHRSLLEVSRRMTRFEAWGSALEVPLLALAAVRA